MSSVFASASFQGLLAELRDTPCPEGTEHWPGDRLQAMARAGVMRWNLPAEFGGNEFNDLEMLEGYRHLASACLVTTFILTQRNGACQRIITSENQRARQKLLPLLASGDLFATVGISHLTTSGRHLATPPVQVQEIGDTFILNGTVPWATSTQHADLLITGGRLSDGRELLAAIPVSRDGIQVNPSVSLMALGSSQTGSVKLSNVLVEPDNVLHGPVEAVMQSGSGGGAGSLGTSVLAVGATEGMLRQLTFEAERRPDLQEFVGPLQTSVSDLTSQIVSAATGEHPHGATASESIRCQANSLVLRTAQSWLAATKGAGYVSGHAAERAVRESMFFLVWSCPQPVLAANLRELACVSAAPTD